MLKISTSVNTPGLEEAERDVVELLAGDDLDPDDEQEAREDHDDLDQTRDERVDPAAEIAGRQPHDRAEGDGEERREDADLERGLRAVEDTEEHVVTDEVRPAQDEQGGVAGAVVQADVRPRPHRREALLVDAIEEEVVRAMVEEVRGDRGADEGGGEQENDETEADNRELVPLETDEDERPVAARLDRLGRLGSLDVYAQGRRRFRSECSQPRGGYLKAVVHATH